MPPSIPDLATEWRRFDEFSVSELHQLLRFRQDIFVVEQQSPYADLDGLDPGAWHLLARIEQRLVGCLRLIPITDPPPPCLRIGRVAVAQDLRRSGLGRILMRQALLFCGERYPLHATALAAQLHLKPFYESFGFAAASDPYDDFGVPHIEMTLHRDVTP